MKKLKIFVWLLLFLSAGSVGAFAQQVSGAHTHVRLVSEQDAVLPGKIFWVGFDLLLDDGWHVYWMNPGDSGLAPKVKWDLPQGVAAGAIHWPYPQRINVGSLTSYGYGHEVFLLVPVTIDDKLPVSSSGLELNARLDWLACKDICVPGRARLALKLSLAQNTSAITFNNFKKNFDETRLDLPRVLSFITAEAFLDGDQWRVGVRTPVKRQGKISFFPYRDDVIEHAAIQQMRMTTDGYEVSLAKSHLYSGAVKSLNGILVNDAGWDESGTTKAIAIHAPIKTAPLSTPFWVACLFAVIGGLILNLMPCVLPVLSIKVLHLIDRHSDRKTAFRHSLVYASGILVSMWALALMLFILKAAGKFAGWGFQYQSPFFVIAVALILFLLALNLFGFFEFSLPSVSVARVPQGSYLADFLGGVITTIAASPCTAPFMGTALTFALSRPDIVGFGVFTSLGLGLALPLVLLSAFPGLLAFVPRPGRWMVNLKRIFGVVLLACVVWLLWVFAIQTGLGDLVKANKSSQGIQWQDYSAQAVDQARRGGHGVFIDFTAAWCINCQFNDRLILQSPDVVKAFKDKGIVALRADWTKYDPAVTQALASYGRESIPVYVYYSPDSDEPVLLPQVVTPNMILKRIKQSPSPK